MVTCPRCNASVPGGERCPWCREKEIRQSTPSVSLPDGLDLYIQLTPIPDRPYPPLMTMEEAERGGLVAVFGESSRRVIHFLSTRVKVYLK